MQPLMEGGVEKQLLMEEVLNPRHPEVLETMEMKEAAGTVTVEMWVPTLTGKMLLYIYLERVVWEFLAVEVAELAITM